MTVRRCAMYVLLLLTLMLGMCGCSVKVQVESDTSWTGVVNGASVEGSGSKTYTLRESNKCVVFQKETSRGFLTIKGDVPTTTTTAEFGVVSACAP